MNRSLSVTLDDRLDDTWKYKIASPGTMYDTPYPLSDTGPNPPPGESYQNNKINIILALRVKSEINHSQKNCSICSNC